MKAFITPQKQPFQPVTITLVGETPDEVAAMYALFNYTPIADYIDENSNQKRNEMGDTFTDKIRQAIAEAVHSDSDSYLDYVPFHRDLIKKIEGLYDPKSLLKPDPADSVTHPLRRRD